MKNMLAAFTKKIHQQLAHRSVPDLSWLRTTIDELQIPLFQHVLSITEAVIFHSTTQVMNLIGDAKGKVAVMVDDMIDTAGTIAKGAALLHQEGARKVYACCTHAVFVVIQLVLNT